MFNQDYRAERLGTTDDKKTRQLPALSSDNIEMIDFEQTPSKMTNIKLIEDITDIESLIEKLKNRI